MKNLQRKIERFFYNNRNKGVHNLMLFIAIGNLIVYLFMRADPSGALINALRFSREKILHGQVWRLFTYAFIPDSGGSNVFSQILFLGIMMFFYYQIGRILENRWGTMKFNAYYLCGIVITDIAALIMGVEATIFYLNLSLILAFATMCPEDRVLLFFIIPLKMKWLAWFYFASVIITFITVSFPYNLFPVFALLNYFLFFGAEIKYVLPNFGAYHHVRSAKEPRSNPHAAPNPNWAASYKGKEGQKPYRHKCTVCGSTDTDYPGLEFRYCSRCKGYYCYCMDHINNHTHIQ